MDRAEFEKLVSEAIDEIPSEFKSKLNNVAVIVEDTPTSSQMRNLGIRHNMGLLGLYEGVNQLSRGNNYTAVMPDKITIFKRPIEMMASDPEGLKQVIQDTVRHEIAHHFGMNEKEVRATVRKNRGS